MYYTRRAYLNKEHGTLCNALVLQSGQLYSSTVKYFWRTVKKKNIWLKPSSLMRIFNSDKLHAHSADASVQQFFNALSSWRSVRKTVPDAKPPKRLRKYCSVTWKSSAIRVKENKLVLSNGKITEPLVIDWNYELIPVTVTLRWTGNKYELVFCYKEDVPENNYNPQKPVAIDIGQIHVCATSEGTILNGRLLRSIKQGTNKSLAELNSRISSKKKGSSRFKRLKESKRRLLKKTKNRVSDILHKYTSWLVMYLKNRYNTLVVGDLTGYRVENNCGTQRNQENHSWLYSRITFYLKYKWEKLGLLFKKQEESYTSKTCPSCSNEKKPTGRTYKCTKCGFVGHRDLVGAVNILFKYLGLFGSNCSGVKNKCLKNKYLDNLFSSPVDGLMARPVGIRYRANMQCSSLVLAS